MAFYNAGLPAGSFGIISARKKPGQPLPPTDARIGLFLRRRKRLNTVCAGDSGHPLRFFAFPAVLFRRLLEIAVAFDIANQTFFFTHFFEPLDHLLDTFTGSCLDFNHTVLNLPFKIKDSDHVFLKNRKHLK
jgi:hypothetical protein